MRGSPLNQTHGKVRIVGGKWRRKKLDVPDIELLRPTPDRVKETLFNWLQGVIDGCVCLDLFAGSGALGFEAASRGAARVVMVEQDPDLVASLRKQADVLQANEVEIIHADALKWLQNTGTGFDLVFLDPPFGKNIIPEVCKLLTGNRILRQGALVYVESEPDLVIDTDAFHIFRKSRAGQVQYMLLEQTKENNSQ